MKLEIVPYAPEHLERFAIQPEQMVLSDDVTDPEYRELIGKLGPAYSGILGGETLACFGLWLIDGHRATAWGLVSCDAGKYFPLIHKAVKRFLNVYQIRRIEAQVATDFTRGRRWAELLGFQPEGIGRQFQRDGKDAVLYARVTP